MVDASSLRSRLLSHMGLPAPHSAGGLDFAADVRRWCAENLGVTLGDQRYLTNHLYPDLLDQPVDVILRFLSGNPGGGWCSFINQVHGKILKVFGFDIYYLNYGVEEQSLTHEVALVGHKDALYISDAYLNLAYCFDDGQPASLADILAAIEQNTLNTIMVERPARYIRRVWADPEGRPNKISSGTAGGMPWFDVENYHEYLEKYKTDPFPAAFADCLSAALRDKGLPGNTLAALTLPLNCVADGFGPKQIDCYPVLRSINPKYA